MSLSKYKKSELIEIIQDLQLTLASYEEGKYELMKQETGLPFDTEEEWIAYIKKIQVLNAERLTDCKTMMEKLKVMIDADNIRRNQAPR
jgi:hypothetical protein